MNLSGTMTFFVRWFANPDGTKRLSATTTIKRKWGEETRSYTKVIDLEFDRDNFKEEDLAKLKEDVCYTMEVEEAFPTLRRFKRDGDEDYNLVVCYHINSGHITKGTKVDTKKRDEARKAYKARKGNKAGNDSPMAISEDELPF